MSSISPIVPVGNDRAAYLVPSEPVAPGSPALLNPTRAEMLAHMTVTATSQGIWNQASVETTGPPRPIPRGMESLLRSVPPRTPSPEDQALPLPSTDGSAEEPDSLRGRVRTEK